MTNPEATQTIDGALAAVRRWRLEEEKRIQRQAREVDAEVQRLKQTIAQAQARARALATERNGLLARIETLDDEAVERSNAAVLQALREQADALAARADAAQATELQALLAAEAKLEAGGHSALLVEYKQYKEQVEPTLAAMPESYRSLIASHGQAQAQRLRAQLARVLEAPEPLGAEPLELELLYAIDAPDGELELLMLVLPVRDTVYLHWASRPEDLQTHVALRVVQALYASTQAMSLHGAQVLGGGHEGLVALEVELVGAPDDALERMLAQLETVVADSAELRSAGLTLQPRQVALDLLLPPDEDEAEQTDERDRESVDAA